MTRCAPAASLRSRRSHSVGGVRGGRVERAGDREPGRLADRRTRLVLAAVEPAEDLDEADRVDVPDAGPGRVVADPRRVAGQREDVPDAERVRAEQLRLDRHEVPVAGREVDEALEVEVVLDAERDGHRAHPDPGHRRVADVDEVDAGVAQEPRGVDRPVDPDRARRVDLDRDDEPPLAELGAGAGSGVAARPPRTGVAARSTTDGLDDRSAAARPARRPERAPAVAVAAIASSAARIAAMCSGVVPQQPPTIDAPAASIRATIWPKYSAPAP